MTAYFVFIYIYRVASYIQTFVLFILKSIYTDHLPMFYCIFMCVQVLLVTNILKILKLFEVNSWQTFPTIVQVVSCLYCSLCGTEVLQFHIVSLINVSCLFPVLSGSYSASKCPYQCLKVFSLCIFPVISKFQVLHLGLSYIWS